MSLTILLSVKSENVGIVRWFRDPVYNLAYPNGPLCEFSLDDFHLRGVTFVRMHFEEFQTRRMDEKDCVPVLQGDDAKAYLKKRLPIHIDRNYKTGELKLAPMRFRKYALGGMEILDRDYCKVIPPNFSATEFWETFNVVLAELL